MTSQLSQDVEAICPVEGCNTVMVHRTVTYRDVSSGKGSHDATFLARFKEGRADGTSDGSIASRPPGDSDRFQKVAFFNHKAFDISKSK